MAEDVAPFRMVIENFAMIGHHLHESGGVIRLPARPLVRRELSAEAIPDSAIEAAVRAVIAEAPADAGLTIRVMGVPSAQAWRVLSAANLRRLSPPSMNVALKLDGDAAFVLPASGPRRNEGVLELPL